MKTKRLILRKLEEKDAYDIYINIQHDREVLKCFLAQYIEDYKDFKFEELLDYFKKNKSFYDAIILQKTGECIGMIFENDASEGNVEIGYAIGSKYWNQGYVSEALQAEIHEIFKNEQVIRIYAGAFKENGASLAVMRKCGMKYSHTIENELFWQGKYHDVVYYEITRSFYE